MDVVVATPAAASSSATSDPFQNATLDEAVEKDKGVASDEALNSTPFTPQDEHMGIKSNLPSTFKGDRGGSAEDADLLAELRAISMKGSTNRFAGEANEAGPASSNDNNASAGKPDSLCDKPWKRKTAQTKPLPPWKKKGAKKDPIANDSVDVVIAAPPTPNNGQVNSGEASSSNVPAANHDVSAITHAEENTGIIKSNFPNTFKGERGGSAEDADLLAELRAISMKGSTDRFTGEVDEAAAIPSQGKALGTSNSDSLSIRSSDNPGESKSQNSSSSVPGPSKAMSHGTVSSIQGDSMGFGGMAPPPPSNSDTEINITIEGLDESLKSSKWQLRKASYLFLHEILTSLLIGSNPNNQLNAGGVYSSLDQAVIHALKDKNAGALDAALTLSVLYADSCQSACSDNTASQIMTSLLKGTAFSSSRSSSLSSTEQLVLKLIEVSPEGSSSINDVLELIQEHGLKSKKPKVVIFSAKLILKSVHTFGAGVFPIPKLSSHSESLIAHANSQAREIGIQLLAEMCRTLGSKVPLQSLVDKLKKTQQSQLDSLIEAQPSATAPSRRLRCKMGEPVSTHSPEEALAALKLSQEEDEAKRRAARPAVNLFQVLPQTCYATKIKLDKWSEKVAALNALIEAGGEQPFKLCPPSGSINYTSLIRELKQLLSHTHFAVCSKALAALGMLAEGVGEQILSNMRPLIPTLVALFKDKKVINAAGSCLDKLFANVFSFENLLDSKDSLPISLDEKKQKNALVRKNVLEYLSRCVKTSGTYGTRGDLTSQYAEDLSKLACEKLKDSEASTRKAATDLLLTLLNSKEESIVSTTKRITSSLETSNPRAYKTLKLASAGGEKAPTRPQSAPVKTIAKASRSQPSSKRTGNVAKSTSAGPPKPPSGSAPEETTNEKSLPSFEDSVETMSTLGITKWGDDIDNEGILAGIQSSNWKARKGALSQLAAFYKTADAERTFDTIPSLFVLVRDTTKSFKESNFNVAKALLELFTVIFGVHSQLIRAPESYIYSPATKFAVEKIGDRKLSGASSLCLHSICTVKDPQRVLAIAVKTIGDVKSPLVHEALLGWFNQFFIDFGAASLSKGIECSLEWVLKECESNNMKVKKAALIVIGAMHSQLGPVLQAFIKSKDIQASSMSLLDKALSDNPHDMNAQSERKMKCITFSSSNNSSHQGSSQPNASPILSIPTFDLIASLKSDCLSRINETEGKAAWKHRRDAMEEVRVSVSKCGGLIATEGKAFLSLKQLFLALRSRLNDSQSNLKPIAATLIGSLMNHIDDDSQAKLGKIVFPALANAAMNDMKKTMRDAAVSALSMGTERPKQNGGGTNMLATESFIVCLELSDAALKSTGLPDVLSFLTERLDSFFSSENMELSNTITVNRQLAKVIVLSLLSSKSGTRSAAEKLLSVCVKSGVVQSSDLDKEIGRLLPAQVRTVRSLIPKISAQEQELVESFKRPSSRVGKPVRPSSSTRQPVGKVPTKSNQVTAAPPPRESSASVTYNEANPLHPNTSKSAKVQRLSLLGRSDNWPEYPEEPSGDASTLPTLRKSWSLLISPSSTQLLFPKGGMRSHEDAVRGCEIISQSIEYSRSNNDVSFLEQLDFIFKWTACALSSRDHTSGLRSLLSMLQLLFERLHELSYVMNDAEATIVLPCILEKAGVAKSQFKDQFMDILSFIRSKELYQLQRYGSNICMKVVEKSKSNRARSLAATECSSCVIATGVGAVGRKGVANLARALNIEKLTEIRFSYLDLFYNIVQNSTLDKVLSIIGDDVTDKTKEAIIGRCSKRPSTAQRPSTAPAPAGSRAMHHNDPKQSRLKTPSRNSVTRTSSVSHRASEAVSDQPPSSTSAVTGALRSRLQRSREESQTTEGSLQYPPSHISTKTQGRQAMPPALPSKVENDDLYTSALNDIRGMINYGTLETGLEAIRMLGLAVKKDSSNGRLNASQMKSLKEKITSDLDEFVETLASVLKFAFEHGGKNAALPSPLIKETVEALTYVFRTPEYSSAITQTSLERSMWEAVHALLDDRLSTTTKGVKTEDINIIVKGINRLGLRAATAPSRETSLLALISLQISTISSANVNQPAKASRVLWKLFNKVIKEEHEKNPRNPLGGVTLDLLLYSLDWLLQTMEEVRLTKGGDETLKHAVDMSKDLMAELLNCRGDSVREALTHLELPDGGLLEKLLMECEHKMKMRSHPPQFVTATVDEFGVGQASSLAENKNTRLADLINNFAEAADGPDKQVELAALIDFKKSNAIDLEAHLSHLSPQFKEFLLDQVGKASKENSINAVMDPNAGNIFGERMKALRLGLDKVEDPPVTANPSSLRARLEALKKADK